MVRIAIVLALAGYAVTASADDKADYQKRVATRYVQLFQALDLNRDNRVSREEAGGDLNFLPVFADIDINRDNFVTADELQRFIGLSLGQEALAQSSTGAPPRP
jgi:hypothetical protein